MTDDDAMLARLLSDPSVWAEPSDHVEDEVVDAVLTAPPVHAVPASVTPLRSERSRRPRRRVVRWIAGASVAAVAAVALVFGVAVTRAEDRPAFESELTATAVARGAHASVEMYRSNAGFRVTLDAHGLPALPPGEYYEAWLWSATLTPVPIGTFSSSDGHIVLWSGVSAQKFPKVTVTVERADKNLAPSGRRVLAGQLHAD